MASSPPLIAFALLLLLGCQSPELEAQRICARKYSNVAHVSVDEDDFDLKNIDTRGSETEVCKKGVHSCYALWSDVPNNSTSIVIIAQGCWEPSGNCREESCVAHALGGRGPKVMRDTAFCCCSADLCNANISQPFYSDDSQPTPPPITQLASTVSPGQGMLKLVVGGVILFIGLAVITIVLLVRRPASRWHHKAAHHTHQPANALQHHLHSASVHNNLYSAAHLKLDKIIGQGRYGTVWLGSVADTEEVAVKQFPLHYSHYYYNEKDIYTLPFMDHPALLTYFGGEEIVTKEGVSRYMLILSYCPNGTLQEYIKANSLDLATFCKMGLSIAAGLAHLHTEIRNGDKWKPCVTHRDVNTKNILVKGDLSCCLSDLGLGVKITGSHYYTLGEEQHAETKSINDVGTLRYMAPEVLEGAVNLRDCESSLKQIDVYALGLVLWEIASRTHDLYNLPSDVPPYTLPFLTQVGVHPTLEQMQGAVCRNKARVLFNGDWRHQSSAGRLIRETVEDCTDQDGEARLTALCVHERIAHLYRGCGNGTGISPTVNQTHGFYSGAPLHNLTNNNTLPEPQSYLGGRETTDTSEGVSEGTVETILTLSPSEPPPSSHSIVQTSHYPDGEEWCVVTLQAHQGRNPCMERNLLSWRTGEQSPDQDRLLSTSLKHSNTSEEEALIPTPQVRWVPEQHANPPIPYLQNRPFTQDGSTGGGTQSSGAKVHNKPISAILRRPLRKLLGKKDEGRVIVSPFHEAEEEGGGGPRKARKGTNRRPASLELTPVHPTSQSNLTAEHKIRNKAKMRSESKISDRVKTPGDVPASVRTKRSRFSLYDDRMMSGADTKYPPPSTAPPPLSLPPSYLNSPHQC